MAAIDFYKLTSKEKLEIFQQIANEKGIPATAVEKDWWVVQALALIMQTNVSKQLVFKGGTSLSKGWNLIERFSEDIDIALDRNFLGFSGYIGSKRIRKLRKASREYVEKNFFPVLQKKFTDAGYTDVELKVNIPTDDPNPEPILIEVYYPRVTESSSYTKPGVVIEIGSRSLREPYTIRNIKSLVAEIYTGKPFADDPIEVPTVNPERTFLEKVFLLHEEFQKSKDKMRIDRLSRHLYDVEKLMDTEYLDKALIDGKLYNDIINHRKLFTKIGGVDYNLHQPKTINPVPPSEVMEAWKKDYQTMSEEMIYGDFLSFEKLIERITQLKDRINEIKLQ
jgi:hypothetical protein